MREILFRGKRTDNGEWVYGSVDCVNDTLLFIRTPNGTHTNVNMVAPSTLGQYTGLKDRTGNRIFEGDIVEGGDFSANNDGYGVVRWCDGAFEVRNKYFSDTFYENFYGAEFTVIGNVHDNPDMLEVK